MDTELGFNNLLSLQRKIKKIKLVDLGRGIYSESMMLRIEDGTRNPDWLVKKRLLERMGVSSDGFEDYLQPEEYHKYQLQDKIIEAVENRDFNNAVVFVGELEKELNSKDRLYLQFIYGIKARIAKEENDLQQCKDLILLAIKSTIAIDYGLEGLILASEEYYYILYYYELLIDINENLELLLEKYLIIISIIDNSCLDKLGKSKIYPMAVTGLLRCANKYGISCSLKNKLKEYGYKAIELLRDAKRTYHLLSLLDLMDKLLEGQDEKVKKWLEAVRFAYQYYGILLSENANCYIYKGSRVLCIGDVVKKRREMLGMSQAELADGLCDVKTIIRIENKKNKIRLSSVAPVLKKLNLPSDFIRLPIITDEASVLEKYHNLKYSINQLPYSQQVVMLDELNSVMDISNKHNLQVKLLFEGIIKKHAKTISAKIYLDCLKKALECTAPYYSVIKSKDLYLTDTEVNCVYLLAKDNKNDGNNELLNVIYKVLNNSDDRYLYTSTGQLLLMWLFNKKGNSKEYLESNDMSDKAAFWTLKSSRLSGIHVCLYNNTWNNAKFDGLSITEAEKNIKYCMILSDFCKNYRDYSFYKKEYSLVEKKDKQWYDNSTN